MVKKADTRQGSKASAHKERGLDLNETPRAAVLALLENYPLEGPIWEPAAGRGAISRVLRERGIDVLAQDIAAHRGRDPDVAGGHNFLQASAKPIGVSRIVTNPPYFCADAFIRHGLELVDEVIVLLRTMALEGKRRSDLNDHHLAMIFPFIERLPMMHRDGWTGSKIKQSAVPFAWFVYRRHHPTPGLWQGRRISWRKAHDGQPIQGREAFG